MLLHASILQIYRPFTGDQAQARFQVDSDYARAISAASLNQLKHLTIVFRHTFTCASYSILWHIALLHVANGALQDKSDPQRRAYFMLTLNSYTDLFIPFRVSKGIVKSLLSMALRLGVMQTTEALTMINRIHTLAIHDTNLERERANFVIDMNLANMDRQSARLDILSNNFDELVLFGELMESGYTS